MKGAQARLRTGEVLQLFGGSPDGEQLEVQVVEVGDRMHPAARIDVHLDRPAGRHRNVRRPVWRLRNHPDMRRELGLEFGGRWYVLASNGDASSADIRGQYPVYDLEMNQVGRLDAPHPTNIPWPMVFPVRLSGRRTRWLLVTFNGNQFYEDVLGYGTHGDLIVMQAEETTRGHEF